MSEGAHGRRQVPSELEKALAKEKDAIENQLTAGGLSNQQLVIFRETNYGGCCSCSLSIGDHHRTTSFQHGHYGIRGSQVDSDDPAHNHAIGISKLTVRTPRTNLPKTGIS